MNCPFQLLKPREKTPQPDPELCYFTEKTDEQVKECSNYDECVNHSGTYETPEENANGGRWFGYCSCRPGWYMDKMKVNGE